jgi:hypothetical protein
MGPAGAGSSKDALFALQAGFNLKRDGDFTGCGVMTFFIAVKITGLPHHWALP